MYVEHFLDSVWVCFSCDKPTPRGSKEQLGGESRPSSSSEPSPQQLWYSPSLVTSPSSSRPQTSGGQIPSHVSPGEAAGIIALLKDKRLVASLSGCFFYILGIILC